MKQRYLLHLFIMYLALCGLSIAISAPQNQERFRPIDRNSSLPVKPGAAPRRPYGKGLHSETLKRRVVENAGRPLDSAVALTGRQYTSPAVGKSGFLAAVQVPAGGGLDYEAQFQTTKGDFSGDGKPDLVTLVRDLITPTLPFSVSVVLSNGDGTFKPAVLTPVQSGYCFAFLVADLNGDHKGDIVILHSTDPSHPISTLDVLISNGDGTFTTGNSYSISSNAIAGATLADVNGDGKLDLVLVDQGPLDSIAQTDPARVVTLLGNGDGTFQIPTSVALGGACGPYLVAGYLTIADLNADGLLDVACLGWGGELEIYLATSANTYGPNAGYMTVDSHQNLCVFTVGDLNADGKPDVIAANFENGTITVYMNNGDGTFQAGFYVPAALSALPGGPIADVAPNAVSVADVNGDGKADMIISNSEGADMTVLLGNGDGTFTAAAVGYAVGGNPNTPAVVADFDGDGIPDIVVSDNEYSLVYLRGYGDGSFQAAHNYYSPIPDGGLANGLSIASGDFNGDGKPDFATSNFGADPSIGITVFLSRPDGTLSPGVNYGSGGGYAAVAVADFNQDGKLDIAAVDMLAGVVRIFSGNGNGTFTANGQFMTDTSSMGPEAVVAADFDHDGYPDLAILNYGPFDTSQSGYSLAILLNNRTGGFVLPATYPLSGRVIYPVGIAAASLKGNGNTDLVIPLGYKPALAVLSGNGDGTFQGETDVAVDDIPNHVAVADLNQDGRLDFAVTVGSSGIDVLLGNGDGTFQAPSLFTASVQSSTWDDPWPTDIRITDIDGDGKLDLAYTNDESGTLGVLFGNGDGTFSGPLEWAAGRHPWGLAIADVNGDGAPDAVVSDEGFAGATILLNANGSAVAPKYSLSLSTSSVDLTGHDNASVQITLTPQNFNGGTVSFGCSGLPSQLSCTFDPQTIQVGNHQTSTTLIVSMTGVSTPQSMNGEGPKSVPRNGLLTLAGMSVFAIVFSGPGKKHRKVLSSSTILWLLCLSISSASCGGTGRQPAPNAGPQRTYIIQVNATGIDSSTGRSTSGSLNLNVTLR